MIHWHDSHLACKAELAELGGQTCVFFSVESV